ncbi:MAG: hydantoinase B/oxoprolinase family protein [Deltaproteobacteria bacterium]|jgi:N-methylhydantoinase B|nr:hydantoinase B/oxoprolinase family protein [Deltaproteobacteria bacterium]
MHDIIEVEVFNKLFSSIAEEMGIILAHSSFSANIKERRDFSCALFDGKGDLVAQAAHIPVHLGAMPMTLSAVLSEMDLQPGDVVIVNDPYQGGSHLPDITLIEPVYPVRPGLAAIRPLFYVVNRAHHADVGGKHPGSMGLVNHLADEGYVIPPTLLFKGGVYNDAFIRDFLNNVRSPEERLGDLRAQIASLARGRLRINDILNRYPMAHISSILDQLKDYSERLMVNVINRLSNGRYTFTDFLDDDGAGSPPIPITVDLDIKDSHIVADFSRSAAQVDTPLNTVSAVVMSATVYVFQCLLGEGHPINQGSYRPLQIRTRPGSIVDAQSPAPVAAGNVETSQRIVDVLLGALAQAVPELIPAASCGSMNNIAVGNNAEFSDKEFSYYETIGGGMGGRPTMDGLSGIQTHMTNTMNTPVEALEHAYPIRVEKYGFRNGSGGSGLYKGGEGIARSYRFLEKAFVSLLSERRKLSPYGLAGGRQGLTGENILIQNKIKRKLGGKLVFEVRADDLLLIRTPGGGGWGADQP